MNFRYPVFLDVTGKRCLVTGEGYEVGFKVQALVEAGARVTYVNRAAVPEIQSLAERKQLTWLLRDYRQSDLDDCFLVISCSARNAEIFRAAEARGVLCNCVDDPKHCRYSYGSKHVQGDLTIAISSNGVAPALAVRLKEKLQQEIGPEYGRLLQILRELRPHITSSIPDFGRRKELWYRLVDSDALARLRAGDEVGARTSIQTLLEASAPEMGDIS